MKRIIICICYFLIYECAYSQIAPNFYKKADSLYKAKDYKNSAIAYSDGIRLEGSAARIGRYSSCACSWSLAGNGDSAFAYLKYFEYSDNVTVEHAKEIENDEDLKTIKSDDRWQPSMIAILNNALSSVKSLADAVRAGKRINPSIDRYEIARAWATAKNVDSTLYYLNSIINSESNKYVALDILSQEKKFSFLHDDPRWKALIDEVKKNYPAFTCDHRQNRPRIPMTLTIDPSSKFIKSDGKGTYRDNEDKVSAYLQTGCNLMLSGLEPLQDSRNWTEISTRYIFIDLDNPVKKSGASKLGMIKDHLTIFHFFYKIDTSLKLDLIYNFNEIPIGATIASPRADIEFYINGKFHMLKFGYWSLGDCGEWYASGGNVNGAGTTSVKIARHTPTSYTIEAPKGSVGRLWDIDNRTKPIDKGLYESGFIIHVDTH